MIELATIKDKIAVCKSYNIKSVIMSAETTTSPAPTVLMTATATTDMGMCNGFDTCIQGIIGGVGGLILIILLVTVVVSVIVVMYKKKKKARSRRKFHK